MRNKDYCPDCGSEIEDGECQCDDVCEGRWIPEVCNYASTCDWCGELTHHDLQTMDLRTQLGYCPLCVTIPEVAARIKAGERACPDGQPLPI